MNITKNHPNSFLILKNTVVRKYGKKLLDKNDVEINDSKKNLTELHKFYSELFSKKVKKSEQECSDFLDMINIPQISEEHKILCDKILSLDDLSTSLQDMSSSKSPGNDGLTVGFYKFF